MGEWVYTCIFVCAYFHLCMYVRASVCVWGVGWGYVRMFLWMYVRMVEHVREVRVDVQLYQCLYVSVDVCVRVYVLVEVRTFK